MLFAVEKITPAMAEEYLTFNTGNRRIRPGVVKRYAAEMAAGRWMLSHQGIAFAFDGRLIDGQHRLLAIIESGVTVTLVVVRNADPKTYFVTDHNEVRNLADSLSIGLGVHDSRFVAGVVRATLIRNRSGGGSAAVSDEVASAFYQKHRDVFEALVLAWGRSTHAAVIACAAACVIDGYAPLNQLEVIGRRYAERDFHGKDDPINRLHAFIAERPRLSHAEKYRLAVTALNAAIKGRSLGVLQKSTRDWKENPGAPVPKVALRAAE